ncbi:putative zinc finger protein [Dirofilaria immitis]
MNYVAKRRKATAKRVERKHACPYCDARFPFPNKLRLHINSNHSLANICELCPERFNRFNELRTHMRRAHQIIHQCHLCAYSSSVKAELKKHVIKCHENGVRCTIDGCAAIVAYNRLRRHIKEAHCSNLQNSLIADDQILGESSELQNNVAEDFSMEMKFSSITKGQIAMNAFSGIKFVSSHDNLPPVDKIQEFSSNRVSSKALSLNAEAFNHQSFTIQHDETIENHCGGYECQKCGKIFCDVYNSRRHWNRVHLKKYDGRVRFKKYGCKISRCTQHFSCPSKLQDHISTVHSEKAQFDCKTCNRKFRSRASFAIHLKRYHLVSIRDVPHGFTDGIDVSSSSVSDEIYITTQINENKTKVVAAENIFTKE